MVLGAQNFRGHGYGGQKICILFLAAPAGEVWAVLAALAYSLGKH